MSPLSPAVPTTLDLSLSAQQAIVDQDGYIEDLVNEGAQGITLQIQWCKPKELTICPKDELAESFQM